MKSLIPISLIHITVRYNMKDKIVVGIISYLPDDPQLKLLRINRLNSLIKQINIIFNLPIMIIAQHWEGISLQEGTTKKPIIIHTYPQGLGINKARMTLREKFIESEFEYMIMLDDDCKLIGNAQGGKRYIDEILAHPGGFCEFRPSLLKLFAISKDCYKLITLPEGGADDKDPKKRYFEDMFLCITLKRLYPERRFKHKMGTDLLELSDAAYDKGNTGWHKVYDENVNGRQWDRHDTGNQTRYMITNATRENILDHSKLPRDGAILIENFKYLNL